MRKYSTVYLKNGDCNGQKLEGFVWEKQLLPPNHDWEDLHLYPSKF